jgi:hypothetical protein
MTCVFSEMAISECPSRALMCQNGMIICADRSCSWKMSKFLIAISTGIGTCAAVVIAVSTFTEKCVLQQLHFSLYQAACTEPFKFIAWIFSAILFSKWPPWALMCENGSLQGLSAQTVAIDEKCNIFSLRFQPALVSVLQSLLQFWPFPKIVSWGSSNPHSIKLPLQNFQVHI